MRLPFLKTILSLACFLTLHLQASASPPNVVLILSDDQAWMDYGFMGHPEISTPHLDRLASRSLLFPRGYVTSPLCRPSLASIVTGRHPHEHGITGNDIDSTRGEEREQQNHPLFDAINSGPNLIHSMTDNGYLTLQTGKWWEGSWQAAGFTHGMTHGEGARGGRHGDLGLKIGREGMEPIESFLDEATAGEQPFFIWYAPFLPHDPHTPPERLSAKYERKGRAGEVTRYYAMCEWFDETCGALLGSLDRRGLTSNTLVVYVCDNGWQPLAQSTIPIPAGWTQAYAPRSKGSPYERGIRTPIMLALPERIPASVALDPVSSIDLYPTILKACGLEVPVGLPGIDLLDPDAVQNREAVFGAVYSTHNMNFGHPVDTLQYRYAITRRWKYLLRDHGLDTSPVYRCLHTWDTDPEQLHAIQLDPNETEDLGAVHPDQARRVRQLIEAWFPSVPGGEGQPHG